MFQTTSPSRSVGSAHEKNAMLSPDSKTKQMIPWAKPTLRSAAVSQRPIRCPAEFIFQGSFLWYSVRKFFASLRLTLLHHKS